MASIQGIYIALFGRPADPAGLAYFNAETNNGADLSAIGDLAATEEYQDRFDGLNNVQVITKIYQELFGRDPDQAGLNFFVAALNSGTQTINTIAINILDGAQGPDAAIVANKIASATLFTAEIDTAIEVGSYVGDDAADFGRAFLAGVTADAASVKTQAQAATAVQEVVDFGVKGVDYTVAAGASETGTSNNDTFTVTPGDYTGTGSLNGGFGNDKATINVGAIAAVTTATSLVSIEQLHVTSSALGASLDLALTTGLQKVSVDGTALGDLTIDGLAKTVAVTVVGANDVTLGYADVAGDADSVTIALDKASGALTVDSIEAITLNVTNGNTAALVFSADVAETLAVTGTGDYSLTLGTVAADLSIDASAHVGKLVFANAGADLFSVIGGAQNDTFTIGATDFGVSITGGAGSDLFTFGALSNVDLTDDETFAASINVVTDFNGTQDTLALTLTGAGTTFTNVQLSDIAGAASIEAALDVAATAAGTANYAVFQYEGDTYIYQNDAVVGFDTGDGLIKLTGFTGELTDANLVA